MKKARLLFLTTIVLTSFLYACSQTLPPDKDLNTNSRQAHNNTAEHLEKAFKLLKIRAKQPLVWTGVISVENLKTVKADSNIWNNAKLNDDKNYNQTGTAIEVDIMNCAGYVVSGKLNKVGDTAGSWKQFPKRRQRTVRIKSIGFSQKA